MMIWKLFQCEFNIKMLTFFLIGQNRQLEQVSVALVNVEIVPPPPREFV